jgi:alginate O-acetyltransferase complex protein AlgI
MLFNSIHFLIFFPIVVILYFIIPQRQRWIFLLAASYYFYMCWKMEYIFLIITSTLIDYFAGIRMENVVRSKRTKYLLLSLAANLGLLFTFKYFNFFNGAFRNAFQHFNIVYHIPNLRVLLPVGISFYTFQTLSYSIDVYRGQRKAERHLGIFALYVAFFPQLVAGPIERSTRLLPQFYEKHAFNYQRLVDGFILMVWGFFKKIVIADRLAVVVNHVYNNVPEYSGLSFLIASYCFALQIYCDFSGYSDIAIGSAKIMGFDLMKNFDRPYFSKSISEFWKRWHISLSSWFRDYLYISLGGNRVKKWRWYANIMIVFLLSGMWHGANWTFLIWGGLHGFYMLFSTLTRTIRQKLSSLFLLDRYPDIKKIFDVIVTFHLVLLGWIFFRANSLSDALYILKHLFSSFRINLPHLGLDRAQWYTALLAVTALLIVHFAERQNTLSNIIRSQPLMLRWASCFLLVTGVIMLGYYDYSLQFIYFQF